MFSNFPIHAAMWKDQTEDGKTRYRCIADFYISSYTPSLQALIQARSGSNPRSSSDTFAHMPLLVVGQNDEALPTVEQEVENVVLAALSAGHTPDSLTMFFGDSEDERDKVLAELCRHGWIHFACHGILDSKDPFSSHFEIGEGKVSFMDIIRLKVLKAELAFCSACRSAEQPEYVSQNEALHLAAAMQLCGFRSVVGTMWSLNDNDGARVARAFYNYMFSKPKDGEEVGYKRSARALNKVTHLMRNHKDFKQFPERWVNFIHIGA